MNEAIETRKRKRYKRPQLRALTIEFGVYGHYGGCDGGNQGKDDAGLDPGWLYKS
jgi:hypothetical protein